MTPGLIAKPHVTVAVVVDVIGALSDRSLLNGNCCLMDDSALDSLGQGTHQLHTAVAPGQVVRWYALAVDLQTPVDIKSITFLGADPAAGADPGATGAEARTGPAAAAGTDGLAAPAFPGAPAFPVGAGVPGSSHLDGDHLDLNVWSGVVPHSMPPGVPHHYRLELQMYEGAHSVMHLDTSALTRVQDH